MFNSNFLIVLWQRKLLFIAVSIVVFSGIALGLLLWPKTYVANARVMVDTKPTDTLSGQPNLSAMNNNYLATQVEVIQSSRVAAKAITLLALEKSEGAKTRFEEARQGNQTFLQYYTDLLQRGLSVKPGRESNIIDISFRTGDPTFAANVANAFARSYIATNLELKLQPAKEFADWFENRVQPIRDKLKKTQREYSDVQRKAGITSADERLDVENARLQELSTQLVILQGQLNESEKRSKAVTRVTGAGDGNAAIFEVMSNPVVMQLKTDLGRLEAKYAELSPQLGKRHPQMIQIDSEITQTKQKITAEIATVTSSVDRQLDITRAREETLRSALASQKEKVLKIKRDRDELSVLARDLDNSQRTHDLVAARLTQTTLESQANMPSVVLLDEAVAPTTAASPRTTLGYTIATLLAPLIGLIAVLLYEALDKRVRSASDLEEATNSKVLCIVGDGRPSKTAAVLKTIASVFRPIKSLQLAR